MFVLEHFKELGLAQKVRSFFVRFQVAEMQNLDCYNAIRKVNMHSFINTSERTASNRVSYTVVSHLLPNIGNVFCIFIFHNYERIFHLGAINQASTLLLIVI